MEIYLFVYSLKCNCDDTVAVHIRSIIVLHNEQSVRRQTFYNASPIYTACQLIDLRGAIFMKRDTILWFFR